MEIILIIWYNINGKFWKLNRYKKGDMYMKKVPCILLGITVLFNCFCLETVWADSSPALSGSALGDIKNEKNEIPKIVEGTYTFTLKESQKVMNLYATSAKASNYNGCNVTLWDQSGNNTQDFIIKSVGDNKYNIISVANGRYVDVKRNDSKPGRPIELGCNVDIWENNDPLAQEWLFEKADEADDDYYYIKLASNPRLVIGTGEANKNGANLFLRNVDNDNSQKFKLNLKEESSNDFCWPINDPKVTSNFGSARGTRKHTGTDMISNSNDLTIKAASDGEVVLTNYNDPYGRGYIIVIKHNDNLYSQYQHLAKNSATVAVGQRVKKGDTIATMGDTGDGGLHLHFELGTGFRNNAVREQFDAVSWLK